MNDLNNHGKNASPCNPEQIEDFAADRMLPNEQREFESHLESCDACQAKLLDSSGDVRWWNDAREFLSDDDWDRQSISGLTSASELGLGTPGRSMSERYVLESLAPTDDPHMLGRLGCYEIAGVIGTGGMGVVLKGFDSALNRFVAIKLLAPHLAESAAARRRFAREAQAAAAVVHENVVAIHSVAEANGLPYLVMPYERGASLQKRLNDVGVLRVAEILRIGMQTAAGLAAAHQQGLVHRDIKPANLLLADGVERVAITDFGLARAVDDASLTRTGIIAGTPQYMSPEQAAGDTIDFRSDLFSLGSVIYTMCTGRPPFRAETSLGVLRKITEQQPPSIQDINPEVPDWLCRIIAKLHSKLPADRFQTAEEVSKLLEDCLAHVQQPHLVPLPDSLAEPEVVQSSQKTQNQYLPRIAIVVGLIGLTIVGWMFWPDGQRDAIDATADRVRDSVSLGHSLRQLTDEAVALPTLPTEIDWQDPIDRELEQIILENELLEQQIDEPLVEADESE